MYSAYNVGAGNFGPQPPQTNGPTNWWANTTVFNMQIGVYLCPSDQRLVKQPITNYMANMGGPFLLYGYSGTFVPLNPLSQFTGGQSPLRSRSRLSADEPEQRDDRLPGRDRRSEQHGALERGGFGVEPADPGRDRKAQRAPHLLPGRDLGQLQQPADRHPNGVTSFLAQCNSLPIGTLGNTTTPRGLYWQVSHPYYANYGMYNHVGAPNSRQCSNISIKASAGRRPSTRPGRLRHLAADQLPPGRGQRHHVRRLGQVHQGHDQPVHLVGNRHPCRRTNRSTPTATERRARARDQARPGRPPGPSSAPIAVRPGAGPAVCRSVSGPPIFWAFVPGIGHLRFRGGRTRSVGRSAPALWVGGRPDRLR